VRASRLAMFKWRLSAAGKRKGNPNRGPAGNGWPAGPAAPA
jgi:hypothetical protein